MFPGRDLLYGHFFGYLTLVEKFNAFYHCVGIRDTLKKMCMGGALTCYLTLDFLTILKRAEMWENRLFVSSCPVMHLG